MSRAAQTHIAYVLFLFLNQHMQWTLPFANDLNPMLRAHQQLLEAFGLPAATHRLDPVSQLVLAMISTRTKADIALPVFMTLANRFAQWQGLARLEKQDIQQLIAETTFPETVADRLFQTLRGIQDKCGTLDLTFLGTRPVISAQAWLEKLHGVGPKTSAATLNLSTLHMRVLVVDTAHHRVARRLGLIPLQTGFQRTTRLLNRLMPDAWTADEAEIHHILMQMLGQQICTHNLPKCDLCPLRKICVFFKLQAVKAEGAS